MLNVGDQLSARCQISFTLLYMKAWFSSKYQRKSDDVIFSLSVWIDKYSGAM